MSEKLKAHIHEIIFEADTPSGKLFDILLIASILLSVCVVMLDSVQSFQVQYPKLLIAAEWSFTILFTIEYGLRLYCTKKSLKYAGSFFGVVDLLSIIPTYLSLFFVGAQYFVVIRTLRILRIFRILKLAPYLREADVLGHALRASFNKILVFLSTILILVCIFGSFMYVIEGSIEGTGFTSIPKSIYWAIVTLTTVGYGDISPTTPLGQTVSSIVMILGYVIIAVPTGIVSVEINRNYDKLTTQACPSCSKEGHESDASHCKFCGHLL